MQKKKRKVQRQRGSKTHGWGSMKKHRGAGHRGGRGNAGTGKRGDAKKPSYWRDERKKGFVSLAAEVRTINVAELERRIERLVSAKQATLEKDLYVVDLTRLGYGKLLGSGNVKHKYKVTVKASSEGAVQKIKEAGGDVVLPA